MQNILYINCFIHINVMIIIRLVIIISTFTFEFTWTMYNNYIFLLKVRFLLEEYVSRKQFPTHCTRGGAVFFRAQYRFPFPPRRCTQTQTIANAFLTKAMSLTKLGRIPIETKAVYLSQMPLQWKGKHFFLHLDKHCVLQNMSPYKKNRHTAHLCLSAIVNSTSENTYLYIS